MSQRELENGVANLNELCSELLELQAMSSADFSDLITTELAFNLGLEDFDELLRALPQVPEIIFASECLHKVSPIQGQPGWIYGYRLRRKVDLGQEDEEEDDDDTETDEDIDTMTWAEVDRRDKSKGYGRKTYPGQNGMTRR